MLQFDGLLAEAGQVQRQQIMPAKLPIESVPVCLARLAGVKLTDIRHEAFAVRLGPQVVGSDREAGAACALSKPNPPVIPWQLQPALGSLKVVVRWLRRKAARVKLRRRSALVLGILALRRQIAVLNDHAQSLNSRPKEKKMKAKQSPAPQRRRRNSVVLSLAALAVPILLFSRPAVAQDNDIFIYPSKGQSQDQQDKDRYECHRWAVQQTGFDPSKPQAATSQTSASQPGGPSQPHVLKGAARGAALGVVGGAIAGNAGKGAAAGAAMGGLAGGLRRRDERVQQSAQQKASAQSGGAAQNPKQAAYQRAMAACLKGRGYSVN